MKEKTENFIFRVDPATLKDLRELAAGKQKSASQLLRELVQQEARAARAGVELVGRARQGTA